MRSGKILLSLLVLALGGALSAPTLAQNPQGRAANDGGMVSAKPISSDQQQEQMATPKARQSMASSRQGERSAALKTNRGSLQANAAGEPSASSGDQAPKFDAPKYPVGRAANDGGFLSSQAQGQGPQGQAMQGQAMQGQGTTERQLAWEGNDAAYGGQYRPAGGSYYNFSPFGAPAQPIAQTDSAACQARFRSFDPASGTYMGFDGARHPCR